MDDVQVGTFEMNLEKIKQYLNTQVDCFKAGRIKESYHIWEKLTSDSEVLNTVKGLTIEFNRTPYQVRVPNQKKFSIEERHTVESEIKKLLDKRVIQPSEHEPNEYISTVFLRPKSDGTHRMILNLKKLNESIVYHHF